MYYKNTKLAVPMFKVIRFNVVMTQIIKLNMFPNSIQRV